MGKDLDQLSLETVHMFYSEAQSAGYKIFWLFFSSLLMQEHQYIV
jgi:hypothetical protein